MDVLIAKMFGRLRTKEWMIATAESCTGGMIAQAITAVPGSSMYLERGFVTYSNQSKTEMLAVAPVLMDEYGAVSEQVAEAMAKGALEASDADIAVSVTGVAGPDGGSEAKPVGLVHIGVATWETARTYKHIFSGDRNSVRAQATQAALEHVLEALS